MLHLPLAEDLHHYLKVLFSRPKKHAHKPFGTISALGPNTSPSSTGSKEARQMS